MRIRLLVLMALPVALAGAPLGEWNPTAALNRPGPKSYFYMDGAYLRYDERDDKIEFIGERVEEQWQEWPAGFLPDAALPVSDQEAHFFDGDSYLSFSWIENRVLDGFPRKIRDDFAGWPDGFLPDAAVNLNQGKAYFFSDENYLRVDLGTMAVDPGYPRVTQEHWPGWPSGFTPDAAYNRNNGTVYFFDGNRYMRYAPGLGLDIPPSRIADHWTGWPESEDVIR